MRRGEIRWNTFRAPDKRRPVLILTRDSIIDRRTSVTIAPITRRIRNITSEVLLTPEEDGIISVSVVNLDNMQTILVRHIGSLITTLSEHRMYDVEQALLFALGINRYL